MEDLAGLIYGLLDELEMLGWDYVDEYRKKADDLLKEPNEKTIQS